jgi:hypothetical protein
MAGIITPLAPTIIGRGVNGKPNAIEQTYSWVASASDGTLTPLPVTTYAGWWISEVETDPGAVADTPAGVVPTAGYGITAVNSGGRDILKGYLANRSDTATEVADRDAFGDVQVGSGGITWTFSGQAVHSATGKFTVKFNR